MKRVAFIFHDLGSGWLGGQNYFRSLFASLASQPIKLITPVLVVPPELGEKAKELFPGLEVIVTRLAKSKSLPYIIRKVIFRYFRRDFLLEKFLIKNNIDVLSHGPVIGRKSIVPCVVWIPDFQHVHLPHFFSKSEIRHRNRDVKKLAENSEYTILSSEDAKKHLVCMFPFVVNKAKVISFAPAIDVSSILTRSDLARLYSITEPYLFLPNQFWAHKNHSLVIKSLIELKKQGRLFKVISTGALIDYRNVNHFNDIDRMIKNAQIDDSFTILGVVPYSHMLSLMYYSKAVINPSFFEGWSTTVEEAKLLEKRLVLSDINIHREQAGANAIYFRPDSVDSCSEAIKTAFMEPDLLLQELEHVGLSALAKSICFGAKYTKLIYDL